MSQLIKVHIINPIAQDLMNMIKDRANRNKAIQDQMSLIIIVHIIVPIAQDLVNMTKIRAQINKEILDKI